MSDKANPGRPGQNSTTETVSTRWSLQGGGEMGELVRRFEWSTTPLGKMDGWSISLKSTVAALLNSRNPMFLWWGPELVQIYNDAYLPSFGVGKHPAALGQRGRDCWPEVWPIIGPQIEGVMQRGEATWHEDALVPIFRNGSIEDVYWTYGYSPVFGDDGRIAGTLVVCAETTARVRAMRLEREAREERSVLLANEQAARLAAEVASRAKDDFLATASHELRTPLNAIMGWATLLQTGKLEQSDYLRAVDSISRNARAQVRLIEDILDGSRIITGRLHLEIRPLDMTTLVQAALDSVRPAAEAKNIGITVVVEPEAARIVGDPDRLQQVVWNLANNAIKFTPKGGATAVSLKRVGTDIQLRVEDTGQGIAPDFLPYVFDRFRQAEGSTTRRHGGLGLGLALVKHLVEAHGGTVHAASEGEGRGATFTVMLPVQAVFEEAREVARPAPSANIAATASRATLHGVNVLVVDDEIDARDLVATALRASGAEVTTASSAANALELLAKSAFMVMVSDVGMPETDGYQLIRHIRTRLGERGAHLPAVALTAYSREEDRRMATQAGFQTHVAKPVDPAELVRIVAGLVSASERAGAASQEAALQRADTLSKFEKLLKLRGVHEALRFLNSRTSHRFTGVYRFDPPLLRNVLLLDADAPELLTGSDAPLEETYCSIVGETEHAFTTEDTRRDGRLLTHPARETVQSYCGVLLRSEDGTPFGTLCHFDLVPCDIPVREMSLMEAAAPMIVRALITGDRRQ